MIYAEGRAGRPVDMVSLRTRVSSILLRREVSLEKGMGFVQFQPHELVPDSSPPQATAQQASARGPASLRTTARSLRPGPPAGDGQRSCSCSM